MRIHDLTHPVGDGTEAGFHLPPATVRLWQPVPERGWWATDIRLPSHIGTHVDAPRHWLADGATVEALDLDILVGPAIALDLTRRADAQQVTVADLEAAAPQTPPRWLLLTGWDRTFGTREYFTAYPSLGPEAAEWIVGRGVRLLGVDMPSLSRTANPATHRVLLQAGVVVVEGLRGLAALLGRTFVICVLPLCVAGADGAPARAVALEFE
ncbi:MAG: cyclase family protein [Armatimonadota bacterium]|nr:cyclase family protein [Armatimonadota bacterium]